MSVYMSSMDDLVLELPPCLRSDLDRYMQQRLPRVPRMAKARFDDWDATDGCILAFSRWTPSSPSALSYNQFSDPMITALSNPVSKRQYDHCQAKTKSKVVDLRRNWNMDRMDLCWTFQRFSQRKAIALPGASSVRVMNFMKRKYRQLSYNLKKCPDFKLPKFIFQQEWLRCQEVVPFMAVLYFNPLKACITYSPDYKGKGKVRKDSGAALSPVILPADVGHSDLDHDACPLPSNESIHPEEPQLPETVVLKSCLKQKALKVGEEWFRTLKSLSEIANPVHRSEQYMDVLLALLDSPYQSSRSNPRFESKSAVLKRQKARLLDMVTFKPTSQMRTAEASPLRTQQEEAAQTSAELQSNPFVRTSYPLDLSYNGKSVSLDIARRERGNPNPHDILFERPGVVRRKSVKSRVSFHWAVQQNQIVGERETYHQVAKRVFTDRPPFQLDLTITNIAHVPLLSSDCIKGIRLAEKSFQQHQCFAFQSRQHCINVRSSSDVSVLSSCDEKIEQPVRLTSNFLSPLVLRPCPNTHLSVPMCHALLKLDENAVFMPSTLDMSPEILRRMMDATISWSQYEERDVTEKVIFVEAPELSSPGDTNLSRNRRQRRRPRNQVEGSMEGRFNQEEPESSFNRGDQPHALESDIFDPECVRLQSDDPYNLAPTFCPPSRRKNWAPIIDITKIDNMVSPRRSNFLHELDSRDVNYTNRRWGLARYNTERDTEFSSDISVVDFVCFSAGLVIEKAKQDVSEGRDYVSQQFNAVKERLNNVKRIAVGLWSSFGL